MTNKRSSKAALKPLLTEVAMLTTGTTGSDSCCTDAENSCLCQDPSAHLKGEACSSMSSTSTSQQQQHYATTRNNNLPQLQPEAVKLPLLEDGLSSMDENALRDFVSPIWNALTHLDAEELLALDRTQAGGAQLRDGVCVRPIHDQITPPKDEIRNGSCVRYLHVAEMEGQYSIGIFVFPPHAAMPLHDHPDMVVLSRILYGQVEKKSLDLERPAPATRTSWLGNMFLRGGSSFRGGSSKGIPSNARKAFKTANEFLQAPAVTMLYPYEGNLHSFVAGPNGAAVLDVLLPPYGDARDCTFYHTQEDDGDPRACWIVPTGQPEDFHCISGEYRHLGKEDEDDGVLDC